MLTKEKNYAPELIRIIERQRKKETARAIELSEEIYRANLERLGLEKVPA